MLFAFFAGFFKRKYLTYWKRAFGEMDLVDSEHSSTSSDEELFGVVAAAERIKVPRQPKLTIIAVTFLLAYYFFTAVIVTLLFHYYISTCEMVILQFVYVLID